MYMHVLVPLALVFLSQATYAVDLREQLGLRKAGLRMAGLERKQQVEFEPHVPRDDVDDGTDGNDGTNGDNACDYAGLFLTIEQIRKLYNLSDDVTVVCEEEDKIQHVGSFSDADGTTRTSCKFAVQAERRSSRQAERRNSLERCDGASCCETCLALRIKDYIITTTGKAEYVAHDPARYRYQIWQEARCGERGNCQRCDRVLTPQTVLVSGLDFAMVNVRWMWYYRPAYCRCVD